jgi:hypothetical protein
MTSQDEMPGAPCQPIGCDHGYHLDGCAYAEVDTDQLSIFDPPECPHGTFDVERCAEGGHDT